MLSAAEVEGLWATLERRLHGVGIETQPEVAARVVELVGDPSAGLRDFAGVIRGDAALSGRLLRLANSAFFAQRQPVTNLERACVLLGLERLKGVSLGFYLSRGSAADPHGMLSRRIWAEGVYRACLAAELARATCPLYAPEAFVVGLMMDSGIPLAAGMLGRRAEEIYTSRASPGEQHRRELESLEFTHVDVAAALCRKWKLPAVLSRPIELHHTSPGDGPGESSWRDDSPRAIHRLGFYVGALRLDVEAESVREPTLPALGKRVLGLSGEQLESITRRAGTEFSAMRDLFAEVAGSIGDLDALAGTVHRQLVEFVDQTLEEDVRRESISAGQIVRVGEHRVEVRGEPGGETVVYLVDTQGARLVGQVVDGRRRTAREVLGALGIDGCPPDEVAELERLLRSIAA